MEKIPAYVAIKAKLEKADKLITENGKLKKEIAKNKKRLTTHKDIVFECNCEGDPCRFIVEANESRPLRTPTYCPNDGNPCRWKKLK